VTQLFSAVNVGDSLQRGLDNLIGFLPNLIGFLIILAIGYVIARVVKSLVTTVLEKIGTDRAMHTGSTGEYVNRVAPGFRPSSAVGTVAFWFLFLGALAIAVAQLGIAALDNFVGAVVAYLPNVVAAILIFVAAVALAGAVGTLIARTMGDTPTGKVVGSVAPVLIMAIGVFMVLDQLNIAPQIVTITYAALLGGLFLAMALAFGLGGRDVAGRMLSEAYERERASRHTGRFDRDTYVSREPATTEVGAGGTAVSGRPPAGRGDGPASPPR
jgi:Mechanosensitive ion channel, conserved TM helix